MNNLFDNLIITEIGSSHDGSFGNACNLIELTKKCGANAVKFQMHNAEYETLKNSPNPKYFKKENRYNYFKRTAFDLNQWAKLINVAKKNKLEFICSPFSEMAVENLKKLQVKTLKIPSGEITNLAMLKKIKSLFPNILLSTGMSNWKEIDQAYNIIKNVKNLCVMQCSSIYPCPPENVGLNIIDELKKRYKGVVGFSDHTRGYAAAFASVALGCRVIEKHFSFSREMYGSDAFNSMIPDEMKVFCEGLRFIWKSLDNPVNKDKIKIYQDVRKTFQKSIVTSKSVKKGEKLSLKNICFKKPGYGIPADKINDILNKKFCYDLSKDHLLKTKDIK